MNQDGDHFCQYYLPGELKALTAEALLTGSWQRFERKTMKKKAMVFFCILASLFLVSCAAASGAATTNTPSQASQTPFPVPPQITLSPGASSSVADYFPIAENTLYKYLGSGNEYASYTVFIEYAAGRKVQQRVDNGGTVMAKVIKIENSKAARVLSSGEAYVRQNYLNATETEEEILLMEPIKAGTTWTVKESIERTITSADIVISTPLGNYHAVEVVTKGPDSQTVDYYAKDVGLVKSVFLSGDTEITSSLQSIQEDVPLVQKARFYYPGSDGKTLYFVEKELSFRTNDSPAAVLEAAYRQDPGKQAKASLTPASKINSLQKNEDGTALIDLNQAFLTEMNAGAQYETLILQSIANTVGAFYQTDRVLLTIDQKPYASGHISLKKGDTLEVKLEDAVEIQ